jgi:hypothetical protein
MRPITSVDVPEDETDGRCGFLERRDEDDDVAEELFLFFVAMGLREINVFPTYQQTLPSTNK